MTTDPIRPGKLTLNSKQTRIARHAVTSELSIQQLEARALFSAPSDFAAVGFSAVDTGFAGGAATPGLGGLPPASAWRGFAARAAVEARRSETAIAAAMG